MTHIRALVVDDSEVFRGQLVAFLRELGITVAGEAALGERGIELASQLEPDLVLLDVELPAMSGLDVARHLGQMGRPPVVIIISIHDDPTSRAASRKAGARAFVGKSELVETLPAVLQGFFPEALSPAATPAADGDGSC